MLPGARTVPIRPRTPQRASRPGLMRHWTLWVWFVLALVLCVGGVCLWKSGRWLIHEDKFEKVRWGVVLAGESRDCERSDAAIRMFHEGRIDTLVISATRTFKTRYNSEFMVDYYVEQGVPRDRVFEFRQDAYSTLEEARLLVRQFRLQNLDTVLIVTTTFHTARTRRIFRKLAGGYPVVLVAAAEYSVYDPSAFWSNREGLKLWFDEWAKTFFTVFELAWTKPETDKAQFQGLTPDIWSSRTPEEAAPDPPPADTVPSAVIAKDSVETKSAPALPSDSANPAAVEAKSALDSAAASAKADSARARKDSVKAHKDSVKAKAAEAAEEKAAKEAERKAETPEAKPAAKDSTAKKSLPRAPKKPAAPAKETKDAKKPASKEPVKASDKKLEKTKIKK
jgi:uncharacterized SAM-binding protein YcdF (DUF218 family)